MSIRPTIALLGLFLCILGLPAAFSNEESAVPIPPKEDDGIADNVPADAAPSVSSPLPGLESGKPIKVHDRPLVTLDLGGLPRPPLGGLPSPPFRVFDPPRCRGRGMMCLGNHECCGGVCHSYAHRCVA